MKAKLLEGKDLTGKEDPFFPLDLIKLDGYKGFSMDVDQ